MMREKQELMNEGQKQMNEWKKEYETMKAPEELKKRIQNAYEESAQTKKRFYQYAGSRVLGGVMAAMLGMVVLLNTNEGVANAMQQVPGVDKVAKVFTFRTYENDTKNHEAKVEVPEVKTEEKSEAAEKVNKSIDQYVNELIKQHKKDIKEDIAKTYEDEYGEKMSGHEELQTDYKVLTNSDRLLTVRLDTTVTMASADTFSKIYHIDKKYDKEVSLQDMFGENVDYVKLLSDEVKKQMKENMKKDSGVSYFVNTGMDGMDFEKIKKNQNFYVNKKNQLVLVFDEYEVAPGYMGQVEFPIDTTLLQNNLSDLGNSVLK